MPSIHIPSEKEIQAWKSSNKAIETAWKEVLRGQVSPAVIGFNFQPPDKLTKVHFVWSLVDAATERRAIEKLERLGSLQGLQFLHEGYVVSHLLGLSPDESARLDEAQERAANPKDPDEAMSLSREVIDVLIGIHSDLPILSDHCFKIAKLCFQRGQMTEFGEHMQRGLQIMEAAVRRAPQNRQHEFARQMQDAIKLYLTVDDVQSANRIATHWDSIRKTFPPEVASALERSFMPFARYYARRSETEQACLVYMEEIARINPTQGRVSWTAEEVLFEAIEYFLSHEQFSRAEELFESLLAPYMEQAEETNWPTMQFKYVERYRSMLEQQGRTADLERLNRRIAPFETANQLRADEHNSFGYIDIHGQWRIAPQFVKAEQFYDGVARVTVSSGPANQVRARLIDKSGADLGPDLDDENSITVPKGYSLNHTFNRQGKCIHEGLAIVTSRDYDTPEPARLPNLDGYISADGAVVIPAQFTQARPFKNGYAIVVVGGSMGLRHVSGGSWGVIDKSGQFVVAPEFDELQRFGDMDLFIFRRGTTCGVVNCKGSVLIELEDCEEDSISTSVGDDMASFRWGPEKKIGYINANGQIAIPPTFDWAYPFEDDATFVRLNEKWGLINKKGEFLIEPTFESVESFEGGVAVVTINGKDGCINSAGKFVVEPVYSDITSLYGERYLNIEKDDGRLGRIDLEGNIVCEPIYDELSDTIHDSIVTRRGNKRGLVVVGAKKVLPPQFVDIQPMYEGLAAACIKKGVRLLWGYVDIEGAWVVPPQFVSAARFSQGLAAVRFWPQKSGKQEAAPNQSIDALPGNAFTLYVDAVVSNCYGKIKDTLMSIRGDGTGDNLIGYIDHTGKVVVQPRFSSADPFCDGVARVGVGERDRQLYGFINMTGEYILPPEYEAVDVFSEGLCAVGRRRQ